MAAPGQRVYGSIRRFQALLAQLGNGALDARLCYRLSAPVGLPASCQDMSSRVFKQFGEVENHSAIPLSSRARCPGEDPAPFNVLTLLAQALSYVKTVECQSGTSAVKPQKPAYGAK